MISHTEIVVATSVAFRMTRKHDEWVSSGHNVLLENILRARAYSAAEYMVLVFKKAVRSLPIESLWKVYRHSFFLVAKLLCHFMARGAARRYISY